MKNLEQELAEIKSMMERSSRFLSLSGLSGVLAGVYALVGAGLVYFWVYFPNTQLGSGLTPLVGTVLFYRVLATAALVLIVSIGTAGFLSFRKSTKTTNQFWSAASKRFMKALFVPVVCGGVFAFALIHEGKYELIASTTLLFYGLGLLGASYFSLNEIKNLGFSQLILGLVAAFLPEYGLLFWAFGFGVLHVVYGALMYYKYDG